MCNSICHLLNFCCRSACPNTSIAKDITAETAVCNVSSNLDTGKEETVHPAVAFAARMVIHWIAWTGRDDAMRSDLQVSDRSGGQNRKRGLGSLAFNSFRNNPYRAPKAPTFPVHAEPKTHNKTMHPRGARLPSVSSILLATEPSTTTTTTTTTPSFTTFNTTRRNRTRSRASSSRRVDELITELHDAEEETERLRSVSQRGSSLGGSSLNVSRLSVTIPTLNMRNSAAEGRKEKLYVAYIIEVTNGSVQWRLARRFSEFYTLHAMLRKYCKTIASVLPKLPSKRLKVGMSKFDPKYTLERREKLELYITALVQAIDGEVDGNDIIDDFLEYTEHMILASVTALRNLPSLMSLPQSTKIADMLQSTMKKNHQRHFSSGSALNNGGNHDDDGDSTDDEAPASALPSAREFARQNSTDEKEIATALQEMCASLDVQLFQVESLKEDLQANIESQESTLSVLKSDLQSKRIATQALQEETSQFEQCYGDTLQGLRSKKSRMTAEKKVLVTEIKSLQQQVKTVDSDTTQYKSDYAKKYKELLVMQNSTGEGKEQTRRQQGENAVDRARVLRSALGKIASTEGSGAGRRGSHTTQEIEITRVQAMVAELGSRAPHQEILIHLRELLSDNCNMQMEMLGGRRQMT